MLLAGDCWKFSGLVLHRYRSKPRLWTPALADKKHCTPIIKQTHSRAAMRPPYTNANRYRIIKCFSSLRQQLQSLKQAKSNKIMEKIFLVFSFRDRCRKAVHSEFTIYGSKALAFYDSSLESHFPWLMAADARLKHTKGWWGGSGRWDMGMCKISCIASARLEKKKSVKWKKWSCSAKLRAQ